MLYLLYSLNFLLILNAHGRSREVIFRKTIIDTDPKDNHSKKLSSKEINEATFDISDTWYSSEEFEEDLTRIDPEELLEKDGEVKTSDGDHLEYGEDYYQDVSDYAGQY